MKHWFADLYASIDAMRLDELAATGCQGRHRCLFLDHQRDQASPGERRGK
jgi:hypothetical protein